MSMLKQQSPTTAKAAFFSHLPKVYAVSDAFDAFRSKDTLEAGVIREIGICS